jgi:hypothetical protein
MEMAQRLERALSIDLVVAWRILALCKAARELPDNPISNWLPAAQRQTLWCYVHQRTTVPKRSPPVRQAVRWIAQLGGFLGRESDGEPGTTTWWRGLHQLEAMPKMWELCHSTKRRQKCGQCSVRRGERRTLCRYECAGRGASQKLRYGKHLLTRPCCDGEKPLGNCSKR